MPRKNNRKKLLLEGGELITFDEKIDERLRRPMIPQNVDASRSQAISMLHSKSVDDMKN